ncbi:MAG: T9SS type A sorting domain-containing protein [Bacteroidetes bacterium]|nr:T9SS type A sorting domain-containing protein [Bacteroidota bacterium]
MRSIVVAVGLMACSVCAGPLQAQSLNSATIGFAGGYVTAPGVSVSFSAGDVVTGTLSAEGISLVQGFPNSFNITPTSLDDLAAEIPRIFSLDQNYPNPFNPSTQIRYAVASQANIRLAVYDLLGREVNVLVNEARPPGVYTASFDASLLASGVYVYVLQIDGRLHSTRKMMLVK